MTLSIQQGAARTPGVTQMRRPALVADASGRLPLRRHHEQPLAATAAFLRPQGHDYNGKYAEPANSEGDEHVTNDSGLHDPFDLKSYPVVRMEWPRRIPT